MERKDISLQWMERTFYAEWERVTKSYRCLRDAETDLKGRVDNSATSIGMPDTFGYVRRAVARGTAQIPNLNFRVRYAEGEQGRGDLEELIGHTLMYQWDRSGTQRWQKLHFLQTCLLGWSVRAWSWANERYQRKRIVDPFQPDSWPDINALYGVDIAALPPDDQMVVIAELLAQKGRGMYLPIEYEYTAYEGPKSDVLSVADCYPQPHFRSIQKSDYFIVERIRNIDWIKRTQNYYRESRPDISNALEALMKERPQGNVPNYDEQSSGGYRNFRSFQLDAYGRSSGQYDNVMNKTVAWVITEEHVPGDRAKLRMTAGPDLFIGEVDSPHDLEGLIPFTEAVLIDDLLSGVGDSVPRVMNGIQQLHDRLVCRRADLVDNIMRPFMATDDRELYENAETDLKRGSGFRLLYLRNGPQSLWTQPELVAMSAVVSSLNDETGINRLWQTGTSESNLSQAANVDPQQNRTATGARLSAYNSDIAAKDIIDMWTETSVKADAWMMYLLNRCEMTKDFRFDRTPYRRDFTSLIDPRKREWVKVSPLDFQMDGEITVLAGSTLADDDEMKTSKAVTMIQTLGSRPDVNQQKLVDDFLIAMGKGQELQQYRIPPQPPPPPPPPVRPSLNFSGSLDKMPPEITFAVMDAAGIPAPGGAQPPEGMSPNGMPPGMPTPPGPGPQGPAQQGQPRAPQISNEVLRQMLNDQPPPGAGSFDAATGGNR